MDEQQDVVPVHLESLLHTFRCLEDLFHATADLLECAVLLLVKEEGGTHRCTRVRLVLLGWRGLAGSPCPVVVQCDSSEEGPHKGGVLVSLDARRTFSTFFAGGFLVSIYFGLRRAFQFTVRDLDRRASVHRFDGAKEAFWLG